MSIDTSKPFLSTQIHPPVFNTIQYTGDNLMEVLAFTGKHPKFDQWFSSDDDYKEAVKKDNNIFKLFNAFGVEEVKVGDYVIYMNGIYTSLAKETFIRVFRVLGEYNAETST